MNESTSRSIRLITLAFLLWGIGEGLFMNIQPLYIEELGGDPAQVGGALSLMGLAAGLAYTPSGYIADRLPRKPVLLGGATLGLAGVLVSALAHRWQGLVSGMVLYGLSACCVPVTNAYLATAADGRNLEQVFTTTFAAYTAGTIFSPTAGGFLAEKLSMRVVYLAAAGLLTLSILALSFISPQKPPEKTRRRGGLAPLLNRRFLRFAGPVLLLFFSMYLIFPLSPNFFADVRGLSKTQIGALGSAYAVGTTALPLSLGRLKGRRRSRGLLLGEGLVWLSAVLLLWGPGLWGATLALLLRGGYQACRSLIQAQAGNLTEEAYRGLTLGAMDTVMTAGQVLAATAAGWLYTAQPTRPFLAALVLIPIGAFLTARLLSPVTWR